MSQKQNDNRKPRVRVVRINLGWIFYLLLIIFIGWLLLGNAGPQPQKLEWAQVEQMIKDGDVKEVRYVRNDCKGSVAVRPESLSKYVDLYPGGVPPKSSPHFFFLTSTKFDPETVFGALNAELPAESQAKLVIENDAKIWSGIAEDSDGIRLSSGCS